MSAIVDVPISDLEREIRSLLFISDVAKFAYLASLRDEYCTLNEILDNDDLLTDIIDDHTGIVHHVSPPVGVQDARPYNHRATEILVTYHIINEIFSTNLVVDFSRPLVPYERDELFTAITQIVCHYRLNRNIVIINHIRESLVDNYINRFEPGETVPRNWFQNRRPDVSYILAKLAYNFNIPDVILIN